jgi:hypothetical protein
MNYVEVRRKSRKRMQQFLEDALRGELLAQNERLEVRADHKAHSISIFFRSQPTQPRRFGAFGSGRSEFDWIWEFLTFRGRVFPIAVVAAAISDDEQIYICDGINHRVQVFDLQGRLLRMWGEFQDMPEGIALFKERVFVTDYFNLCAFDRAGTRLWVAPCLHIMPRSIVLFDDKIIVLCRDVIRDFDLDGTPLRETQLIPEDAFFRRLWPSEWGVVCIYDTFDSRKVRLKPVHF